jgi:hypothetical protein
MAEGDTPQSQPVVPAPARPTEPPAPPAAPIGGYFVVSVPDDDPKDIKFQPISQATKPIPQEQVVLADEVSRTLSILRLLYDADEKKFMSYHSRLLGLARFGLVGPTAQPLAAKGALQELRDGVVAAEAGRVKNRYMKQLGVKSAILCLLSIAVALLLNQFTDLHVLANFIFLWGACMAGVWVSFGARKPQLAFDDLVIPEQDRLEPAVRLFFAGLLTMILGLLFELEVVVVKLGISTTAQIGVDPRVAILIGLLCGFSEQVLSTQVSQQASRFLSDLSAGQGRAATTGH